MTVAYADARPQGLAIPFRPGNPLHLELTWPTGQLVGRTFVTTIDGVALSMSVVGDLLTIDATEAQTAAVDAPAEWLLTETTAGASNDLLIGTWKPSTGPGTPTSLALSVTAGEVEVAVTVVSGQSSVVALAARQGTVVTWRDADAWDRFDETPVTLPTDSVPALTTSNGFGVVTHGAGAGTNDRRIYYLEHTDGIRDAEVRLDFEIAAGNCQCGIALRGDNDTAVIVWSNVIFGVNANLLQGVWEFDGVTNTIPPFQTNQDPDAVGGYPIPVATASGDGTTVTVRTTRPHGITPGELVGLTGVGSFGNVTATVLTATSFTFASATSGTWTGGTVNHLVTPGRRKVAVRLIGNQITFKQWLPGIQDEPAWDDVDQAETNTLPATLANGGPAPVRGKIGIVVAHLGADGVIRVNDLQVTNLDPLDDEIPAPVADDVPSRDDLGLQVARIDDHLTFPVNPSPRWQNLVGWAFDPAALSASTIVTGGTVYMIKIPIDRAATISNVLWVLSTAATTPTAGQNFVGLYSPAGTRLATAGVDSASSSTGLKTTAITPVAVPPGFVWVAFVFNAATPPTPTRGGSQSAPMSNVGLTAATARWATNGTGQTSLPASITPSSNTLFQQTYWAGVS